jgi:hypothetical protein
MRRSPQAAEDPAEDSDTLTSTGLLVAPHAAAHAAKITNPTAMNATTGVTTAIRIH